MILCGFDLETSGLAIGSKILEVACALYDTETKRIFNPWSTYVWGSEYPEPEKEALAVNGLSVKSLEKHGIPPQDALEIVMYKFREAEGVVAHNGISFDRPILLHELGCYGFYPELDVCKNLPIIDTKIDLPFPESVTSRRLVHLAADHGILNPFPHQALFDVVTMLTIAGNYDLEAALNKAKTPVIRAEAVVTYDERQKPKDAKYSWDALNKVWFKNMREFDFEAEVAKVPFIITKHEYRT